MKTPTPECDKMLAVKDESQTQGAFLDWLTSERGIQLAVMHEHSESCREEGFINCGMRDGDLMPCYSRIEELLAEYHQIDLKKVEQERRAILEELNK